VSGKPTMRVTRAVLVKRLRDRVGLTQTDASACLETVLALVERALVNGEDVRLVGFGQFNLRQRAARMTVHPATGEPVPIEARQVVSFRPARGLKELIDQSGRSDSPSDPPH